MHGEYDRREARGDPRWGKDGDMDTGPHTRHPRLSASWLILLVGGVVGALLLLVLAPGPTPLGRATGDPGLARDAAAALAPTEAHRTVSVSRIRDGRATWTGFGDVTTNSRFELGSITKTFDGLLLADAVERGEVRLDDRLDAHLPELAGTEVGTVTLEELVSHRAGLPAFARPSGVRIMAEDLAGAELTAFSSPTPESVVSDAATISLSGRGEWVYSNLGASLLGFALARTAGAPDWPTYVEERLLEPLGMHDTLIAEPGRPAPDLMQPHLANGHRTAPWTGSGYAPAGVGVTTTATDLTTYARAILDGTAPGTQALDARWDAAYGQRIGLAWMVADSDGHPIAWHNGGTGGTRTMLAIDRDRGEAAIVLTNSQRDVTGAGFHLLVGESVLPQPPPIDLETAPWVLLGSLTVVLFAFGSVRGRSRARILGHGLGAAGGLLLWGVAAPWDWAPPWTFGLAAGLALAALVVTVRRWADLPWRPEHRRRVASTSLVLGGAWLVAMVALAVWVAVLRP